MTPTPSEVYASWIAEYKKENGIESDAVIPAGMVLRFLADRESLRLSQQGESEKKMAVTFGKLITKSGYGVESIDLWVNYDKKVDEIYLTTEQLYDKFIEEKTKP